MIRACQKSCLWVRTLILFAKSLVAADASKFKAVSSGRVRSSRQPPPLKTESI